MATVDLSTLPVKPTSFGRWQQLNGPLGLRGVRHERDRL